MPWPQSRRRRSRKAFVAIFGRKQPSRPAGWQPKPKRVPTYTRPGYSERLQYVRLSEEGWSAREIARWFHRDHHTVLRGLEPQRLEHLALNVAFRGWRYQAITLATHIGDPRLLARVEQILELVLGLQHQHEQQLNKTLRDAE